MAPGLTDEVDIQARERVGTVLGEKWTLERMLGIGGMAAVYEGRHRNGARAAIKVLHPSLSRHAEIRERFLREGYAANKVEHPGAVKVLDDDTLVTGHDAGTAYIVMELLSGESLQDRLERGPPLDESEFLGIAAEVLDVLHAAHTRGVVHRDLKPENLFLVRPREGEVAGPRVKVLDFGLARLLDGQSITSYGLALGTPSFMSPEQAAGRIDEIDGRTDLFALGATGFRVRTGRRVQEGANAVELVTKMASRPAPRIRALAPEVSASYARVVDRALEFKRDDRYADAAAMREDVLRAIAELEAGARTVLALDDPGSSKPGSARPPAPPVLARMPLPPPRRPPSGDATVELIGSDLEVAGDRSPSLPVVTPPKRRRRRSLLPWVTLLVLGAIGGKVAWDARRAPAAGRAPVGTQAPAPYAAAPPTIAPAAAAAPAAAGGSASGSMPALTSAPFAPPPPAPSAAPPPAPAPASAPASPARAAATHARPPPKLGPGNVHALPSKRRKK